MDNKLIIKGAKQHNLKNISLELSKNQLIVFSGVSGSGKSSLAFDTIYAEGQRRYVESLSSYARQFLGIMDKPDVDSIIGLSPAISIDQKSRSHNPRSTVGTVTEIYDYIRLLFARIGHPHCPVCNREISKMSVDQIVNAILVQTKTHLSELVKQPVRFMMFSPVIRDRKGEFSGLFENLKAKGFSHVRIDGKVLSLSDDIVLIKTNKHTVDAVIDKFSIDHTVFTHQEKREAFKKRLTEAVELSLELSNGRVIVSEIGDSGFSIPEIPKKMSDKVYSEHFSCPNCSLSIPEIEPRSFSFNSPHGACPACSGIGYVTTVDPKRIISPHLTIQEGGILPFANLFFHDTWYTRIVKTVCDSHGISTQKPILELDQRFIDILLFGTQKKEYSVFGTNRFGEPTKIREVFAGFIPELLRRYKETTSEYVRKEIEKYMEEKVCEECLGMRLKKESLTITIDGYSINDCTKLSILDAIQWFEKLIRNSHTLLSPSEYQIATPILNEILLRLTFLSDVGLTYLTLDRGASTLSSGESQRIRLASQIGSGLSGVLYILDEPSIGLHQKDNKKLIQTLKHLRDLGNTVIVVEHDREMMTASDTIVDFGPYAGDKGGHVVAQGSPEQLSHNPSSLTGLYLSNKRRIKRQKKYTHALPLKNNGVSSQHNLILTGARQNNLKNLTVSFPLGNLICVTGVSGSGKSSLVVDTLFPVLQKSLNPMSKEKTGIYESIKGVEHVDKAILIDQSPIGRTPRSNPATYTGLFTSIRDIFAMLSESKERGYKSGRFSFNVKGGRCEACQGAGQKRIEMQFLSDVYVTCDVCHGSRYNSETLEVFFHEKNISQILSMTVQEAMQLFRNYPPLFAKLKTLFDVGLSYIRLGQSATTLSGGEAQRVKLASELSKKATGKTVYILDEPTTGLHFYDLENLLSVFDTLTSMGNTVIVVEHNLDIIKNADYIIDLGPKGGDMGGKIIAVGTPSDIKKVNESDTGTYLV